MLTGGLTATRIANAFDVNLIYARQLCQSVDEDSTLEDIQRLINTKPKPFVKWVGGKRQLLKQFRELGLYPPEAFNPITNTSLLLAVVLFFSIYCQKMPSFQI